MQITKIEKQKKADRYSLYIDGEFAFGVHEATLIQFGLYRSQPIDEATLDAIKEVEKHQRLYSKAVNYLSFSLRTVQEVRTFLKKAVSSLDETLAEEETESFIEQIIATLTEQGYLNDVVYAQSYTRDAALINRKGPHIIRHDLAKKGIPSKVIAIGLAEYSEAQQQENLLYLADKFIRSKEKLSPRMQAVKLRQYLQTKGYTNELIEQTMNQLTFEIDNDVQLERLNQEAMKLYRKRRLKYKDKALVYKIKEGLYQKGYDMHLIQQWLDENAVTLDEDTVDFD